MFVNFTILHKILNWEIKMNWLENKTEGEVTSKCILCKYVCNIHSTNLFPSILVWGLYYA